MIKSRFVTEAEVEEAKQKRQEEWEAARNSGRKLPSNEPEAPVDYRSLYEKLQEQKVKKQEEHDEQFKFKNMIYKGLDQDESDFLAFAASKQAEFDSKRFDEESEELKEYRESVNTLLSKQPQESAKPDGAAKKSSSAEKAKSQKNLLSGVIRRKRKSSPEKEARKTEDNSIRKQEEVKGKAITNIEDSHDGLVKDAKKPKTTTATHLSSLAMYSDSSDDSDS